MVKSPIHSYLTGVSDTVSVPISEALSELSLEVAESEQQSQTAEQEFLQDLMETLEADSTIDSDMSISPPPHTHTLKKKKFCTKCSFLLGCRQTLWDFINCMYISKCVTSFTDIFHLHSFYCSQCFNNSYF